MAESRDSDGWMKVESRTRNNKFYFFNVYTGESVWKLPKSVSFTEKTCRPKGQDDSVIQSSTRADLDVTKAASRTIEAKENTLASQVDIPPLIDDSIVEENVVDMLDVTERWFEDEEIDVDMDITTELQQQVVYQVQEARAGVLHHMDPTAANDLFGAQISLSSTVSYQDNLYLVLDTNILLSHLDFLMELKDCAIKGVGRPVLVIPWTVMQELDGLKNQENIGERARRAIHFLHSCFISKHPRVRGQTMEEVNTELSNVAIENNDDRILHCCLVYQSKVESHGGLVVLFSNDTQLCSKSLVNGIKAVNRKILLPELRSLCKYFQSVTGNVMSYTHTVEYAQRVSEQVQMETIKAVVDDIICETESLLRDGLSVVVEEEMKVIYSNLWLDVVVIKPPWTFNNIVQLMEKHWIAVFGFLTSAKAKVHVNGLVQHCKTKQKSHTSSEVAEALLEHATQLMIAFSAHSNYNGVITHCLAALKVLHQKLAEVTQQFSKQSQDVAETEVSSVNPNQQVNLATALQKLSQSPPSAASEQFPWSLELIYEGVKLHSTHIVAISRERKKSGLVVQDLREQLEVLFKHVTTVLASINNFVCGGSTPPVASCQDLIQVIDKALQEVVGVPNPLTLTVDALYNYWLLPESKVFFQRTLTEFNQVALALQDVVTKYF